MKTNLQREEIIKKYLTKHFCKTSYGVPVTNIAQLKQSLKDNKSSCYGFAWNYEFNNDGIGLDYCGYYQKLTISFKNEEFTYNGKDIEKLLINTIFDDSFLGGLFGINY